jgi:hypothetical protein
LGDQRTLKVLQTGGSLVDVHNSSKAEIMIDAKVKEHALIPMGIKVEDVAENEKT